MHELLILLRLIHFAGAMAAFGAAAFRVYGLPEPADAATFSEWLMQMVRIGAAVTLLASVAMLPCVAAQMAGSPAAAFDPAVLATVLGRTWFGSVLCWHAALVSALLLTARLIPAFSTAVFALAAAALASIAWIGHAAMLSGWRGIGHELNQAVHLVAAGAWLGGLPPLFRLLRTARRDAARGAIPSANRGETLRYALAHFSQIGYVAVIVIALTGAVNTIVLVGSVERLTGTAYGRLLLVKIALYLALVLLAVINRFVLVPRLTVTASDGSLRWLCRSIVCEQGIGLLVLAAVAVLGTWPPVAMRMP